MTDLDMRATAAQKFSNQFGDNNMKTFQAEWAKNADSKVFQVINIAKDPNMTDKQRAKETKKILGTNPEAIKIFNEKYQNIRKLEATGKL